MAQTSFGTILDRIRTESRTEKEKGTLFERLMQRFFRTDPRYDNLTDVWLWRDFPMRQEFGGADLGIDLVARTDAGGYWAIQCKCYAEGASVNFGALSNFLATASRTFTDIASGGKASFSNLLWVQTSSAPWTVHAKAAVLGLKVPFSRLLLPDLEQSTVNWQRLYEGGEGRGDASLLMPAKQPRPHQTDAVAAAVRHYVAGGHARGKMIMACGTGKTYTSLRIMEELTAPSDLVLFFVPSIALLSQTLNAWMADRSQPMRAICVCSDAGVSRRMSADDADDMPVSDLALPATTDAGAVARQLLSPPTNADGTPRQTRTVIMSTYQSIDTVSAALRQTGLTAALCICDEAHRTTGIHLQGLKKKKAKEGKGQQAADATAASDADMAVQSDEELEEMRRSAFMRVHSDECVPARRRLYMTATPRIYADGMKRKVSAAADRHPDLEGIICSMDDETVYGPEFYRLSFHESVRQGLLTDYKVVVLTVSDDDLSDDMADAIRGSYAAADTAEKRLDALHIDDAVRLIGCVKAMSKQIEGDGGVTRAQDPAMMRRAVAFCPTIRATRSNPLGSSTATARHMPRVCDLYRASLDTDDERRLTARVEARHVDGAMDATERNAALAWLKDDAPDDNTCRVLCNVRCLSEGVDVPALDAVLFLSPRRSQVEVVQSVGRVMRSFGRGTDSEKRYGYIVIPVLIPNGATVEEAMADDKSFGNVWSILNALRSHDENFNAIVNRLELAEFDEHLVVVKPEKKLPREPKTTVPRTTQLRIPFKELQNCVYARIVEKVGDRLYWESWARQVGEAARKLIDRIGHLVSADAEAQKEFRAFVSKLQDDINPQVDDGQAIEMLSQHLIMGPVFDALFADYDFVRNNVVSRGMEHMMELLRARGFEMETEVLERFYTSVRITLSGIVNLEAKQKIIKDLYEKFFRGAFPLTVAKLGIVYTPVECVDFIIRSADDLLRREFHTRLTNPDVHILDPFTGTGTFVTRLLQSGLIRPEDMRRKYHSEIFCNEIVLLAYYVADVNIESVYQDLMSPDAYETYNGICLTDTFQLAEPRHNHLFTEVFRAANPGLPAPPTPSKGKVRVIMGNPPYSVGQRSANDNAQNGSYPVIDSRIGETYAAKSDSANVRSLYDSYIRAFRWASDCLPDAEGGIAAFISNGGWLDGSAQVGFRRCLAEEFSAVYVLNLRGNQRTQGELSRREGGKIFGSGSRTSIAITLLVKRPHRAAGERARIYYHDIGDYLSREQKLQKLRDMRSADAVEWTEIFPNDKGDWINQRDGLFDTLLPMAPEKKFDREAKSFFTTYSLGVKTARDPWCYNSSREALERNIKDTIAHYNATVDRYVALKEKQPDISVESVIDFDSTKFSWDRSQKENDLPKGRKYEFCADSVRDMVYRPFCRQWGYFNRDLNSRVYRQFSFFPTPSAKNLVICVSGTGVTKDFSCIITDRLPDYEFIGKSQCFPLYWYEDRASSSKQMELFEASEAEGRYVCRSGVSEWIVAEVRRRYKMPSLTARHVFHYVYGLLHSAAYRERFADDLRKALPRLPLPGDAASFLAIEAAGRALAELHLNYENAEAPEGVSVLGDIETGSEPAETDYAHYAVDGKMRYRDKADLSRIDINSRVSVTGIPPEAYRYIVNGRTPIAWIMERYTVGADKKSLIANDCNAWAREHRDPRYVVRLLLSAIGVSVETAKIVEGMKGNIPDFD